MSSDLDNKIIELVLSALDGNMDSINALEDRVIRSKAKAALFKAKKDPAKYRAENTRNKSRVDEVKETALSDDSQTLIAKFVLKGLDGDMDSINAIEDRVTRSKVKSALVKAKKNPDEYKKIHSPKAVPDEVSSPSEVKEVVYEESTNLKIKNLSVAKFPGSVLNENVDGFLMIDPSIWYDFAIWLKTDPSLLFDSLQCQTGFDIGENILEARYNLHSMSKKHYTEVRIQVPIENPQIPSVEAVWRIADWFERETYDMFGIEFLNHRDLRRILLPEDWEGWPLRKNYEVQETYHGIVIPKMKEGWE
jgi:NADH-quinone oxidoreductase subunit C